MAKFLDKEGLNYFWGKIKNLFYTKTETDTLLGNKADTSDLPTVNNATLTIKKNGQTAGTFTANSAISNTIDIVTRDSFGESQPLSDPTVGSGTWTNVHAVYLQPGINIVHVCASFQYKNLTGYRRAAFSPESNPPGSMGYVNTVSSPPVKSGDTTLQMTCLFNVTEVNSIFIVWAQQNSGEDMVVRPRLKIIRLP